MSLTEQEELGITLFHKRKKLGLLQGEVALMVGVEKPTISAYECGVVKNIALRTRVKLAQALDLSLEEILYDSEKGCLKLRRLKE
nr:MAG TPA: helix-turn-helix domain protein [Caudoviricetes sp.]